MNAARQTARPARIIVTSTDGLEGCPIQRYLGFICGEAVIGAGAFKSLFENIKGTSKGIRLGTAESALIEARDLALKEMRDEARQLGANAVVGVDVDYQILGMRSSHIMVSVNGTAVLADLSALAPRDDL